jgi:hypothetical protein
LFKFPFVKKTSKLKNFRMWIWKTLIIKPWWIFLVKYPGENREFKNGYLTGS